MQDIFGLSISPATVENITKSCSDIVMQFVIKIKLSLKWVHTLSNDEFVHYRLAKICCNPFDFTTS